MSRDVEIVLVSKKIELDDALMARFECCRRPGIRAFVLRMVALINEYHPIKATESRRTHITKSMTPVKIPFHFKS